MLTATSTDIIIETTKDLTTALTQINKNPLLPPYETIKRKAPFKLNYILSNASSALKPQPLTPNFKLIMHKYLVI